MLAAAFSAGVTAAGVDIVDLGVIPTPGVAALAAALAIPGAVISASHNPFADNGIKLFAAGGAKLSIADEARIEARLHPSALHPSALPPPGKSRSSIDSADELPVALSGTELGTITVDPDAVSWYRRQVLASLAGRHLDGLRVVIDSGNGAATATAEEVLGAAGADVVDVLGGSPDGTNINAGGGSTDPGPLRRAVVGQRADVGLAFDGDADRVIAVDANGSVVDGDSLIALCALDLRHRQLLRGETVVVTVMTNLGFHQAMAREGIAVHQTPVGDRHVLEALDRGGWSLGGEQSGHLIFRDLATTGDGVLSGLQVLDVMVRTQRPLAELAETAMQRLPQVLRNVTVVRRDGLDSATAIWDEVRAVEADLGGSGRVLLRPSGTERMVRVMVEAPTEATASAAADRIAELVAEVLGA
jgi:phosphoglucosamine mutase